jgi:hypothetical protein
MKAKRAQGMAQVVETPWVQILILPIKSHTEEIKSVIIKDFYLWWIKKDYKWQVKTTQGWTLRLGTYCFLKNYSKIYKDKSLPFGVIYFYITKTVGIIL